MKFALQDELNTILRLLLTSPNVTAERKYGVSIKLQDHKRK
jgi:hypothetical protein